MNIEPHQVEQFAVAHLGEQQLRAPFQHVVHQLPLRFEQLVDAFLDGATTDELVHQYILLLADTEGTVGRLIFHRRIPPAVEVNHMGGGGEVQSRAARL